MLEAAVLEASEQASAWRFSAKVAGLISLGGWDEEVSQTLSFTVEVLEGVAGLFVGEKVVSHKPETSNPKPQP